MSSRGCTSSLLSVPTAGRTIQKTLEPWANPLFDCYTELRYQTPPELRMEIVARFEARYGSLPTPGAHLQSEEGEFGRACAAALSILLLARLILHVPTLSFQEAEAWFLNCDAGSSGSLAELRWLGTPTLAKLQALSYGPDLLDLLPYVMEVFDTGPTGGSKSADVARRNNRSVKRQFGTFYTPSDVAEFIVGRSLDAWLQLIRDTPNRQPTVLDAACGTGVLLRAALEKLATIFEVEPRALERVRLATHALYGIDLSPIAVQGSSFALLAQCLAGSCDGDTPGQITSWRSIMKNHACADATEFLDETHCERNADQIELPVRGDRRSTTRLGTLFARLSEGADVFVGNPPYSSENSGSTARGAAYLPFVRMMWEFTRADISTAGAVVPLSLGYHSGAAFQHLRRDMAAVPAAWEVAFFDRTPDSLFGDDVKTRNSIAFMERGMDRKAELRTSTFVRWNSRQRDALFSDIAFCSSDWTLASKLLPKLGRPIEVDAYRVIRAGTTGLLREFVAHADGLATSELADDAAQFWFGSTAYNWLPLFRALPAPMYEMIANRASPGLTRLRYADAEEADLGFAVCSSRLAYWLWRVEGDGFHLSRSFVLGLPAPFRCMSKRQRAACRSLVYQLWQSMLSHPILSVNKGVSSVSYSPARCAAVIDAIDELLAKVLRLPNDFPSFLSNFVHQTIVAGREVKPAANTVSPRMTAGVP